MNKYFYFFVSIFFLFSCQNNKESSTPQKGKIKIAIDQSFKNITEALVSRYQILYPNTEITIQYQKEDSALINLLQNKTDISILSRNLTEKEQDAYKSLIELPFKPAYFALDAPIFIVSNQSSRNSISINEIKNFLQSKDKPLIFSGWNTSNLNTVTQKLQLSQEKLQLSFIKGDSNIIKQLPLFPNKIGVISYNTISREFSPQIQKLKKNIKILPVIDEHGNSYFPDLKNIRKEKYPFSRTLYFLTNEGHFGLANGFIKFSCTQKGQITVSRDGLQPYYLFKRTINITYE